ncbi:MAG: hypothetical protein N3A38_12025 [Planctomycetota bacterium]|nr:hypothetical protein [Planctomycetota bacterium]
MGDRKATEGCGCGQVVFDLTGRAAGSRLWCPWCGRRYRLGEGGVLSLEGHSPLDGEAEGRSGAGRNGDGPDGVVVSYDGDERSGAAGSRPAGIPAGGDHPPGEDRDGGAGRDAGPDAGIGPGRRVVADRRSDAPGPTGKASGRRPSHVETRMRRMGLEIKPLRIIRWVFLGGAAIYLLSLLFLAAMGEVELELRDLNLFGFRISGKNPVLWITAAAFFALLSLAAWAAHTYFFVYRRRVKEAGADKAPRASGSSEAAPSGPPDADAPGGEGGVAGL